MTVRLSERWRLEARSAFASDYFGDVTPSYQARIEHAADAAVRVVLEDYLHRLNVMATVTDGTAVEDMRARLEMHLEALNG